jgi:hypothetical protein
VDIHLLLEDKLQQTMDSYISLALYQLIDKQFIAYLF